MIFRKSIGLVAIFLAACQMSAVSEEPTGSNLELIQTCWQTFDDLYEKSAWLNEVVAPKMESYSEITVATMSDLKYAVINFYGQASGFSMRDFVCHINRFDSEVVSLVQGNPEGMDTYIYLLKMPQSVEDEIDRFLEGTIEEFLVQSYHF